MIGGHDLIFYVEVETGLALNLVWEATRRYWKNYVIEDAVARKPISRDLLSEALGATTEIMIFKDQACRDAWRLRGAASENENTMVYAIAEQNELTVVVGDPNKGEMKEIVAAIRQLVYDPLFHSSHHLELAR